MKNPSRALCAVLLAGLAAGPLQALAQNVRLATSAGDIVLQLDAAKAPKTVENFVTYVKSGHYDGTVFHRVIEGFMIQGGGMDPSLKEKPTRPPIALETQGNLRNVRGAISMARTGDPDSATSQFFINVVDNARLDPKGPGTGYAVFGRVVEGMDVVDKIKLVRTGSKGPHQDVPLEPILIKKASLEK
jgi:peptidyl-prolyl cis-trans isomerase A (cyclophilin A)